MASIKIADSIVAAVAAGKPVVALESTIFTHGLPRPRNYEVALEGEEAIRAQGAVPATIGVYHGVPTVGLTPEQIKELSEDDDVFKASIRDLAYGAVTKKNGGTTIAATTFLAYKAGIKVFATGGLGGVHHGASENFDESADLLALAKYPIVLVSSGAKAVLDIHATLERFETLSVPVVGYQTNNYPGFYVADSGYKLANRVESPEEVATIFNTMRDMGLSEAICVGNPVPEAEQLDPEGLDVIIEKAWQALEDQNVEGQAVTPFLLEFIRQETNNASLDANVALYFNNARVAADIAAALAS
ncbi:pseudouridine-5'-phosphate glycosidase [Actinobaculum suis]|uniref:Pseudouridine-5'-phosphate glycosidase n=1 Tax=Actinobaculum suis TaxID=1657 RepID=A0A0K9EV00_9ACTO|nr:pseudouridine-5'-phosphate glycosidase [Actinobaculum suis]KMY23720.1 pseudouridine-5'-phosphate glycosidase [Actinobaculum suis]MDY5153674.1 pseudouridine-5'-phosphate glycosidase [Actinobaculum suis]OCA93031.1 pseudouridine-5-phosphate glycosidase [Actinobaculum suis]OCA93190.1 pseudouridine-5-phosphate glycosidase [Actinobaculum suis]SDE21829.1 pseudouridine-5'-phosphate glycosidase [Actinobaculum suis]